MVAEHYTRRPSEGVGSQSHDDLVQVVHHFHDGLVLVVVHHSHDASTCLIPVDLLALVMLKATPHAHFIVL